MTPSARCPITYDPLPPGATSRYSARGLRLLSPRLTELADLGYSAEEQRREALARAAKMSIQGVQPKLSARLAVSAGMFEFVDRGGTFILKPQTGDYAHLPENEDLTMRLAAAIGIEVPLHGMIFSVDGSLTYFVQRFDRRGRRKKVAVEDFAQLSGRSRETKYAASMEDVAGVIDQYATFPLVDKLDLFVRTVFCFLCGNEDMHLKNFSLVTRDGRVSLSPAYDLVNTTLAIHGTREELALPVRGRKNRLSRGDLVDDFGRERLRLPARAIGAAEGRVRAGLASWPATIAASFLPENARQRYAEIVQDREARLFG